MNCAASIYSAMKGSKTFQLKPVAHGWANVIVAELIFTLMLVFVVPSVVTVSSSLSQFSGFAIGMCVAIGGRVMGKISERSVNPEAYSVNGISSHQRRQTSKNLWKSRLIASNRGSSHQPRRFSQSFWKSRLLASAAPIFHEFLKIEAHRISSADFPRVSGNRGSARPVCRR